MNVTVPRVSCMSLLVEHNSNPVVWLLNGHTIKIKGIFEIKSESNKVLWGKATLSFVIKKKALNLVSETPTVNPGFMKKSVPTPKGEI